MECLSIPPHLLTSGRTPHPRAISSEGESRFTCPSEDVGCCGRNFAGMFVVRLAFVLNQVFVLMLSEHAGQCQQTMAPVSPFQASARTHRQLPLRRQWATSYHSDSPSGGGVRAPCLDPPEPGERLPRTIQKAPGPCVSAFLWVLLPALMSPICSPGLDTLHVGSQYRNRVP